MTDREAEIIRKHKMTISAFTDRECVLSLWRFEDGDVYGETPFDPTVYQARIPGSREQIMRTGLVTIVGVDSNTMTIRALRASSRRVPWLAATYRLALGRHLLSVL